MRLKEFCEVYIDKLVVRDNILTLAVAYKDASVGAADTIPRFSVKFENAEEMRILPLPIVGISFEEKGVGVCYAQFDYELDCLFSNGNLNEFTVVVQVYNQEKFEELDVEEMTWNPFGGKCEYTCAVENRRVVLRRKKSLQVPSGNWFVKLFCGVYRLAEIIIGTLLLPLFLLDGIYVVVLDRPRRSGEKSFGGGTLQRILWFVVERYEAFCRCMVNVTSVKRAVLDYLSVFLSLFCKKEGVLFVSSRRDDVTGNIACVNEVLKEKDVNVLFWLESGKVKHLKFKKIISLAWKIAKSKVVIVDDFTILLNDIHALKHCKYVQLWHACGAFKTFGFSRLGKEGGPEQSDRNHRNYDYAIVSSSEIRRFYAEGFGIDEKKVESLGVPRTDIFFDDAYKTRIIRELYRKYPVLENKKVVLFAPTFRGTGAGTAYYPFEKFDADYILKSLGEDYVLIVKHHPFVKKTQPVEEKERYLDLSGESEINDLLFVTDVLITDYSSVVFEASLLDIPMLFYAFDLDEYTVNRDFYYPYKKFVPGKIVQKQQKLIDAIQNQDYDRDKIEKFKKRFFDDLDGKSSERVADFVLKLLEE
jgi:CDP-glycerol glycerophosphotransferase (TagB/SpsB family)